MKLSYRFPLNHVDYWACSPISFNTLCLFGAPKNVSKQVSLKLGCPDYCYVEFRQVYRKECSHKVHIPQTTWGGSDWSCLSPMVTIAQVLSAQFLRGYEKDIINIHHGLLPSFKGANPYRQVPSDNLTNIFWTCSYVSKHICLQSARWSMILLLLNYTILSY